MSSIYILFNFQQVEIELKARIDKVSAEPEIEDSACCITLRKLVISIFTRCRGHNIHLQWCYLVPPWRCCRRSWLATFTSSRNFRKSHLVQLLSSRGKFFMILSSHLPLQLPCIIALFSTHSQECSGPCFHHGCPLCCPKLVSLAFFVFVFTVAHHLNGSQVRLHSCHLLCGEHFQGVFFLFDRNHGINDISKQSKHDQDFVKSYSGHPCTCLDCLNCVIQSSRPVYVQKMQD